MHNEKLQQYFNSKLSNYNLTTSNTIRKVPGVTWCTKNDTFVFDFKNSVTLAEIYHELVQCFMIHFVQLYHNLD